MDQACACAGKAEELAFVAAGGRAQCHPASVIGLAGGRRLCCFALPGDSGSVLVDHRTAGYRAASGKTISPIHSKNGPAAPLRVAPQRL